MANPSLKNGYTSIANELVEKLAIINIPGGEMRIVWAVWRKTWAWKKGNRRKDIDRISLSQFEKMTGMKHSNCAKGLKSLVVKRILLKSNNGYSFNQNHDEWVVVKRIPPVVKSIQSSSQKDTKSSSQKDTYKRKERNLSKERGSVVASKDAPDIVKIIDAFKPVNPSFGKWYGRKDQRDAISRMLKIHGLEMILKVLLVLPKTKGIAYIPIITTPVQLEDKWAALEAGLMKEKAKLQTKKSPIAFS